MPPLSAENASRPLYTITASPGSSVTPCSLHDILKLPAMHRLFDRYIGLAAMLGYVQQHAARQDAVAPRIDSAVVRALEGERVFGLATIPHAVLVPDMA